MTPDSETGLVAIADRVLDIARTDPNRVAMIHAHHRLLLEPRYDEYTYGELSRRAESLAVGLRGIGVREGTLCSFMVPPCFDSLVLGVALWRVGAVTVGIEPHSHGLRRVTKCLAKVQPEVFFGTAQAHLARKVFGWGRGSVRTNIMVGSVAPPGMATLDSLIGSPVDDPVPADVKPSDVTVIAFTTGSTGEPKPTVLTQRNFSQLITRISEHWGFDHGDEVVDMPTFPMFWIIGLSTGGTVVVPPMDFALHGPGDADPAKLFRTIEDCGVRSMFASPALLENLASYAEKNNRKLSSVKRIVAGGAEIQGPLFARVKAVLGPESEMYSDYGATEALPVAEISGSDVLAETWSLTEQGAGVCVGTPLPGVDVRIVEISDSKIASWGDANPAKPGEPGEVVVRGSHISPYYYQNQSETLDNKISDETGDWHRMGDTGVLDDEGRLWIYGRRSHRVETAAGTIFPLCCEPIFNSHDAVRRSALVGAKYGSNTVPVICIERVDPGHEISGVSAAVGELEAELSALAEKYEATRLIRHVVFVDRLPVDKRHNAKIDRPALSRAISRSWNKRGATRGV